MRTSPVAKMPGRPGAKGTPSAASGPPRAVALDDERRAGHRLRAAAPRGVRGAHAHALELDPGDAVPLVGDDARGGGLEDGPRALLDGLVDLVRGGHVLPVAPH